MGCMGRCLLGALGLLGLLNPSWAQRSPIASFAVGPDETPTYPNSPTAPNHLVDLPDEHTTIIPPASGGNTYLVFAASKISGGTGGAVVLQTTDLKNFDFATALGYNRQVMAPPFPFGQCNSSYETEFDENYAAPGSVVQDPTLPAGNLIMIYEAENHCPGGVAQFPFYATVGFARSSDNGRTWPPPVNGVLGGPSRNPILQSSDPQPAVAHPAMGDAIPSAFADRNTNGEYYLYVSYGYYAAGEDGLIRVARAKLGQDPLTFLKWHNGSFSQPGIGGSDSGVLPAAGCTGGTQFNSEINYNDDLGLYLMIYVCISGPQGARAGAWYYSTATSLDLQDWTAPQMILNSRFPVITQCSADGTSGRQFDGWYPSFMSPGAAAGHTKLTGHAFFLNGCDAGARQFMSRAFTITISKGPSPPQINAGGVVNNASYGLVSSSVAPGSIAALFGANLTDGTSCLPPACNPTFSNGRLGTTMAGAQVTVNGTPVPIFYAASGQLGIQIPFEVVGTSATVSVSVAGQASTPATITLAPVAPGIFTATSDGKGAGAITHVNGSAVTPQNPAQRGELVILYATGLGPVAPAVPTGALPAGASSTVAPVTLTVGGIDVIPDFAGLAGCCVGLNQINARIPAGVSSGNAVPVALNIGGKSSNTATIAVQ